MASYGGYAIEVSGNGIRHEFQAAGTITPGMLLSLDSSGYVVAHAVAGGVNTGLFAVEADMVGDDYADDYASGELVQCVAAQRGQIIYAIIADGQNVSKGDPLESDGAGSLNKHTVSTADYSNSVVGIALDAVNAAATSGDEGLANRRCRVLII